MKLRLLPITPLTRDRRPLAMLCRKVTRTWEKTSAAHCLGSGSQLPGLRNPNGVPEECEGELPVGHGVGTGVGALVGTGVARGAACAVDIAGPTDRASSTIAPHMGMNRTASCRCTDRRTQIR